MPSLRSIARRSVFFPVLWLFILYLSAPSFASTIGGFVYDKQRNPVSRVDVELLNDNRTVIDRTKTNGVGRYQFQNVADGRYYLQVLPFRFSLEDQTQEIIVETFSILGGGNGYFDKDFYLLPKRGGLGETTTGVVFAQDVPKEAEDLYKKALEDFSKKNVSAGMKKLIGAINVFPQYYAASQRLGMELLISKQYLDATKLFMRSAEVNPKSSKAFYYMGFALNKMGKKYNKAAIRALDKAAKLAPASWEVALLLGKVERQEGNFVEAEKELLRSKKLSGVRIPEIHIELAQLYGNDLKQFGKAADELNLYMKASKKKDPKIKKQIADLRNKAKQRS